MSKFWIVVGSRDGSKLLPPKYDWHKRHSSLTGAVIEAERLAIIHTGYKFYVMEQVQEIQKTRPNPYISSKETEEVKTYTREEAARAMLDGKTLTDGERSYKWIGLGFVNNKINGYIDIIPYGLYEEPKPEKKVVLIEPEFRDARSGFKVQHLSSWYASENDAIRSAMEYLLGCTAIEICRPSKESGLMLASPYPMGELNAIHTALFHRWPIEVIKE